MHNSSHIMCHFINFHEPKTPTWSLSSQERIFWPTESCPVHSSSQKPALRSKYFCDINQHIYFCLFVLYINGLIKKYSLFFEPPFFWGGGGSKNTAGGCHSLLQKIFLTQGLTHWKRL